MTRRSESDATVSREVSRPARRAVRTARFHIVHPPEVATVLPVGRERLVVGRNPEEAGAPVEHPTVSRKHLAFDWDGAHGRHLASDLGSRNGSRVNAQPITEHQPLLDGAVVRFGDVVGVYELPRGDVAADAADVSREHIPGDAAATRLLRLAVARAAPDPSPVLLIGETGTGKEWIAREIHRLSGRDGPLLAINCAALSPQLVESELFGHVKGAFTGATASHAGLFRSASGGSLFLDEIAELAPDLQPKLLRALQEGEVQPVGSVHTERVDVRVIAATNRDLAELSRSGGFRRDLYARLSLWEVRVPRLTERRADILPWVERLAARWREKRSQVAAAPLSFHPEAVEALLLAPFALNLRDVDRLVHALCASPRRPVASDEVVAVLGTAAPPPGAAAIAPPERRRQAPTREELEEALRETRGNVRALARRYGRDRRQIYRWVEAFGLEALLGELRG
jgi:transcriptional regulator with GAF, ATPase, and Fis domain